MSYTFKKILSAVKFIFAFVFIHLFCISLHAQALDTLYIGWTGEPGELEDAINSNPDFDVYVLESNKVFLQEKALVLNNSCQIIGAPYGDVSTLQPFVQHVPQMMNNFTKGGLKQLLLHLAIISITSSQIYIILDHSIMIMMHLLLLF